MLYLSLIYWFLGFYADLPVYKFIDLDWHNFLP